jgi:hypothetical protein
MVRVIPITRFWEFFGSVIGNDAVRPLRIVLFLVLDEVSLIKFSKGCPTLYDFVDCNMFSHPRTRALALYTA